MHNRSNKTVQISKISCLVILLVLFGSLRSSSQSNSRLINKVVNLKGRILNYNNQVLIQDLSEFKDWMLSRGERSFVPDSAGYFNISFELEKPNYFRTGRNIVYLTPGDKLQMEIDFNQPTKASFTGDGALVNSWLRNTPYPKMGSFLEGEDNIKTTFIETVNTVEKIAAEKRKLLKRYKNFPPDFVKFENARITADLFNSIAHIQVYYPYVHRLTGDSLAAFNKVYHKYITDLSKNYASFFVDTTFLKLEVYRNILPSIVKHATPSAHLDRIVDWIAADKNAAYINKTSSRQQLDSFHVRLSTTSTSRYKNELMALLKAKLTLVDGDEAVDFLATLPDGKTIMLSNFRGKIIYIDVWATWCGPCLDEMKTLQKLKDYFKGNDNIVFLSLSIDDNQQAWKNYIEKHRLEGEQVIVDRSNLGEYFVTELPRAIVIDKNFEIVSLKAPLPSQNETLVLLNGILENRIGRLKKVPAMHTLYDRIEVGEPE